ncbi:hypothetical protein [Streptomyces adustus]
MRRPIAVLIATTVGMVLFSAAPANASATVNWKSVSTNSNWSCGSYINHDSRQAVRFKACIVTNASGGTQAVLVVQNTSTIYDEYLDKGRVIFESQRGGDVWCAPTNLAAGATAGCYAPTVQVGTCTQTDSASVELTISGAVRSAAVNGRITPC